MKFTIVSGSTREVSQSLKVAKYVESALVAKKHEVFLLDLAKANLKFWDEAFWNKNAEFDANWTKAQQHLQQTDALIIVAPEWNGMIPPALKNFFHLATNREISNKPGLIISVSSGINGVYPVTELRLNSYKNTDICYIPQHVIVRNVEKVLNDVPDTASEDDKFIRQRIACSLDVLCEYAKAFTHIRQSDAVKNYPFPYGM